MKTLIENFYSTRRFKYRMADHGGAFGCDIQYAMEIDYLIKKYECKYIIETGTHCGDTVDYLARQYPNLNIYTCEINGESFDLAFVRLQKYDNVHMFKMSAEKFVKMMNEKLKDNGNILYYLDAHSWGNWTIWEEIRCIDKGVIVADDANIDDPHYGYDDLNNDPDYHQKNAVGEVINYKTLLREGIESSTPVYYNNSYESETAYEYPCINTLRRGGRMYLCKGIYEDHFKNKQYFRLADEY